MKKKALILGCGSSLNLLKGVNLGNDVITVGVNDCGSVIVPDYLVVVDNDFSLERRKVIDSCKDKSILVSHIPECFDFDKKIKIDLGNYGKLDNLNICNDKIDWSTTSTYMASIFAYKFLGCNNIALLGVDFTPNHYNRDDGKYKLDLNTANEHYKMLSEVLSFRGCEFYNLSKESLIEVKKMGLIKWLAS